MEPAMIRVAHKVLMAVVSICGLCIKSLHRHKLLNILSIALFSDGGGIKDQFRFLASLEAEELQMKGSLTLIATETNKRNIEKGFDDVRGIETKIFDSGSQLNASATDQRVLDELKTKLDFDDSDSQEEYRACQDSVESRTCLWLKTDSQYQS